MSKARAGDQQTTRWGTPRIVTLGQLGRARAEREWVLFHADTADLQIDRAQAAARLKAATARLESTTADLEAQTELPDGEARESAPGEESARAEVVRGRRAAEHKGRLEKLHSRVRQAESTIDEAAMGMARLDEQIRIRREVAEIRVAMIEAYVRRRCSAYLNRLVRKHPDGKRLGSLIRTDWEQRPSWLQVGSTTSEGGA